MALAGWAQAAGGVGDLALLLTLHEVVSSDRLVEDLCVWSSHQQRGDESKAHISRLRSRGWARTGRISHSQAAGVCSGWRPGEFSMGSV